MSRKQIYGITLTTEERRMAGYDRTPGLGRPITNAPAPSPAPRQEGIVSHSCRVTLPDGTDCGVGYSRYGGGGHAFHYYAPLGEYEYGQGGFTDRESIEARAQELVARVWRKAAHAEQKSMRLPSAPSNLVHTLDKAPQLTRKTAQRFAGLYAVCMRYPSGTLTPLSLACEQRSEALRDLARMQAEGGKPTLVIGVCCRWARRWQEPRFLTETTDTTDVPNRTDTTDTAGATVVREKADDQAPDPAQTEPDENDTDDPDPDEEDDDEEDNDEDNDDEDNADPFEGT